MVANPPVMMACISDRVSWWRYGLMMKGAVACPRKMLAAALRDSHAVVPGQHFSVLMWEQIEVKKWRSGN